MGEAGRDLPGPDEPHKYIQYKVQRGRSQGSPASKEWEAAAKELCEDRRVYQVFFSTLILASAMALARFA